MLNVGVFDMGGAGWTGGITYLRNLGHAVKASLPDEVRLHLVRAAPAGTERRDSVSDFFDGVIQVTPFAGEQKPVLELFRKSISVLAGGDILNARRYENRLRRERINVVFGNGLTNKFGMPSVGWFPDFQHLDLPEFFSRGEVAVRSLLVKRMARNCTLMVFSSQHAKSRFVQVCPDRAEKARVLNFVAHLPDGVRKTDSAYLIPKLKIPEKFIYVPNQLWKHKNHLTAFRAVKILADRNKPVSLVCSGNLNDSRHPAYRDQVFRYVQENGLADRVFLLGMVDFDDVYALIRQSCCVLNPSLYEGWSTTVEETKTIGKPMILSDLEVHREQNPPETLFFEPKNAEHLAEVLAVAWDRHPAGPHRQMEAAAAEDYPKRSQRFAQCFAGICREAVERKQAHPL